MEQRILICYDVALGPESNARAREILTSFKMQSVIPDELGSPFKLPETTMLGPVVSDIQQSELTAFRDRVIAAFSAQGVVVKSMLCAVVSAGPINGIVVNP